MKSSRNNLPKQLKTINFIQFHSINIKKSIKLHNTADKTILLAIQTKKNQYEKSTSRWLLMTMEVVANDYTIMR